MRTVVTSTFLLLVPQQKQILDYSTRNRKFKHLEPYFQPSATRSGMKEDTKSAVALAHSRECTKELISGLPNFCSQGTVELEQKNEMSSEKKRRQTCFHWLCCRDFWQYRIFFVGSATQVRMCQEYTKSPWKGQANNKKCYSQVRTLRGPGGTN